MPEEEKTARLETVEEAVDDAQLRGGVEVDQDVAAENQVEAAGDAIRLVLEIHVREADARGELRTRGHPAFLRPRAAEHECFPVVHRNLRGALDGPDSGCGAREHLRRQV